MWAAARSSSCTNSWCFTGTWGSQQMATTIATKLWPVCRSIRIRQSSPVRFKIRNLKFFLITGFFFSCRCQFHHWNLILLPGNHVQCSFTTWCQHSWGKSNF
jgi:hypothetical protein